MTTHKFNPEYESGVMGDCAVCGEMEKHPNHPPAAQARADEPVMIDPVKAKALVEEQLESTRRSQIITAEDLQKTVRADAVPPSSSTERPRAEPPKVSLRRCITRDMYQCTLLAGHDGYHRYEWEDDLTSLHRREQSPPSSPERERAQELDTPWRLGFTRKSGAVELLTSTGEFKGLGATLSDAERIRDSVNAEAEREAETRSQLLLGDLLSRTCDALKGQPPVGTLYSTHDLPDVAAALVERLKAAEQLNSHDWQCGCGHWNGANLAACALCTRPLAEARR